jgi:polyhydroxyalkanoate synthesis regulator phasin
MDTTHIQELQNIDLWVKIGAINFDRAKKLAQPHIDAINKKAAEIAKKHGVRARKVYFHNFVH